MDLAQIFTSLRTIGGDIKSQDYMKIIGALGIKSSVSGGHPVNMRTLINDLERSGRNAQNVQDALAKGKIYV